ncbi:hypothetical protein OBBRIDRAFT_762042 [Obba rivulosa]|uniref:Uncharacterized protein n=1 Tax=Obba rivulosa TaxID=1052685 RepID=A0A8E2AK26_9APHY|nr:hypothetical protein OBBRIDRAFT_762042 [Obba rivulosa]
MLSSLGMDSKTSRTAARSGPGSKYLEIPRGFSVHIFKNPAVSTHPHSAAGKVEFTHSGRPPMEPRPASKPPVGSYPTRPDLDRKGSLTSSEYRNAPAIAYPPLDRSRAKPGKGYGIYPSSVGNMYIYERSISSASDLLASSPSSSSSDSDVLSESAASTGLEISSTRASSSTETLEATLSINRTTSVTGASAPTSVAKSIPLPINAARASQNATATPSAGSLVRPEGPTIRDVSTRPLPIVLAPGAASTDSDSDSDTVFDEPILDMLAAPSQRPSAPPHQDSRRDVKTSPPHPAPIRRGSDERPPYQATRRRDSMDDQPKLPLVVAPTVRYGDQNPSSLRAPPGLPTTPATVRSVDSSRQLPTTSSPLSAPPAQSTSQVAPSSSSPIRATASSRPVDAAPQPAGTSSRPGETRSTAPPLVVSPSNRPTYVRSESTAQTQTVMDGPSVTISKRCVRWTEALVCPSPIPKDERRKGWFNCRGDQLWTNDGKYKSPEPGKEYPPDLAGYPDPSSGWMNEEGTRIDMQHRLIPKPPLRSALKRPRGAQ